MMFKNLLFIAEGQLGDLLLLTPAIKAVKKTFPFASISLLVIKRRGTKFEADKIKSLKNILLDPKDNPLYNNPNLNEILVINHEIVRSLKGFKKIKLELSLIRFLRKKKYDAVVCTFPQDRFLVWAWTSGAKIRVGEDTEALKFLLTHKVKSSKEDKGVLLYYLDLVKQIGAKEDSPKTEFFINDESKKWAEEYLKKSNLLFQGKKLITIHPGASGNYKIWPAENFSLLIDLLIKLNDVKILLCGGSEDFSIIDQIKNYSKKNINILNTGNDINKLASVFSYCALTITNDSGPRHLSAAINIPNLTFFRKYHDTAWKIYPENKMTATLKSEKKCKVCPEGVCLDKIPPNEMFGSYCIREINVNQAFEKIKKIIF